MEYIEVRCIDVNPYLPLGIDADQIRFLDCFLLFCLFDRSPLCNDEDTLRITENLQAVVNRGREPGLLLQTRNGDLSLQDWGNRLMDSIDKVAAQLDQAHGGNDYQRVCQQQRDKLTNPSLTPSAQILDDMRTQNKSYFRFAMDQSMAHGEQFRQRPLSNDDQAFFQQKTLQSKQQQAAIEAADQLNFDDYLAHYYGQYDALQ